MLCDKGLVKSYKQEVERKWARVFENVMNKTHLTHPYDVAQNSDSSFNEGKKITWPNLYKT